MVAKFKDPPEWIPVTPEAKTASNRRKKSTPKPKTASNRRKKSTAKAGKTPKLSKTKGAKPKILKKRRAVRKRMSLSKLVELTRVVNDLGGGACAALSLSWMNTQRQRSNTSIRRRHFPSTFAAHVVRVQADDQNVLEESDEQDHAVSFNGNTEIGESSALAAHIVGVQTDDQNVLEESDEQDHAILFSGNGEMGESPTFAAHTIGVQADDQNVLEELDERDRAVSCNGNIEMDVPDHSLDKDIDASAEKMDCDGPNRQDQNGCVATVSNSDDDFCSSSSTAARSTCDGVILEFQLVIVDEAPAAGKIDEEEDLAHRNEAHVMAAEFKKTCIPLTPQIQAEQAEHGSLEKDSSSLEIKNTLYDNNHDVVSDGAKTASNCGESLIDILKKMSTHRDSIHKRGRIKMKRHNPKVINQGKSIKPATPEPRTPKSANATRKSRKRPCRRKLDFDGECSTPPKIYKKRRRMRQRVSIAKLNNLIKIIREKVPSTLCGNDSDDAQKENVLNYSDEVKVKNVSDVEKEDVLNYSDEVEVENVSDVEKEDVLNYSDEVEVENVQQENVENVQEEDALENVQEEDALLIIQDEAFREALEDFAVERIQSLCLEDNKSSNQLVVRDLNRNGAVVISCEQVDSSKSHKAMVDLDSETIRVWDVLMGNNWSEANEAEAIGDEEYMRKERKLFREKLEVFLSRMHLVQGNRQFSPWKGSIVDSIVGVFLTQNVSDHLSSSAFMALAATYPPLSVDEQNSQICLMDQQVVIFKPSSGASEESSSMNQVESPVNNGNEPNESISQVENGNEPGSTQGRKKRKSKEKQEKPIAWDELRIQYSHGISRKRTEHNADSVNWKAVSQASAAELAKVIIDRGMSNQLAGRIKGFLDRLVRDHGSIDLEWLRNVPPLKAKDYLLSISGLGLKSTECVRLLALHFPAFPVDTNAGRFFVRVGWVPLKPLPENVQLHLLNQYPILDSIQKYIWPRVCDNDHPLLYQTHCHSVTIAKSFCTKTKPNCKECPMRGECKHYASALASARPHLEGSQPKSTSGSSPMLTNPDGEEWRDSYHSSNSEPIIEFPASPERETMPTELLDRDIEDMGCEFDITTIKTDGVVFSEKIHNFVEGIWCDSEITTIKLSGVEFSQKINRFVDEDEEMSKALVAINPCFPSIPAPKLKFSIRLRTVHQVYELPDSHPLLSTFDNREREDPNPYLLAIWTTDEGNEGATACDAGSSCSSSEIAEYRKQERIRGTILIPCRTATRGSFPLNGTYFQINEVFADHESSRQPIDVPRELIWNLTRRTLYCGTSITAICRDMTLPEIAYCFNRSFACIRGFDRKSRKANPLARKFHICKSRPLSKE